MKRVTINPTNRKEIIKAITTSLRTGKTYYTNGVKVKAYKTSLEGYYPVTELLSKKPEACQAHYKWINKHLPTTAKIYEWNSGNVKPANTIRKEKMIVALKTAGMSNFIQYVK